MGSRPATPPEEIELPGVATLNGTNEARSGLYDISLHDPIHTDAGEDCCCYLHDVLCSLTYVTNSPLCVCRCA